MLQRQDLMKEEGCRPPELINGILGKSTVLVAYILNQFYEQPDNKWSSILLAFHKPKLGMWLKAK